MRSAIHLIFLLTFIMLTFLGRDRMIQLPISHSLDYRDLIDSDSYVLQIDKSGNFHLYRSSAKQRIIQCDQSLCTFDHAVVLIPKRVAVFIVADRRLSYGFVRKYLAGLRLGNRCKIDLIVNAQ
ncbi:hypothetical protein DN068_18890 [Taibaiella soli]|uniref:Uncharacterized protein n=1 Tax=Taibaiella soli TaxID=1649169 RepID=A0A2W2A7X8_9BACT|nr:hypothetical protein DN068_18890 [Taibaiella soli]